MQARSTREARVTGAMVDCKLLAPSRSRDKLQPCSETAAHSHHSLLTFIQWGARTRLAPVSAILAGPYTLVVLLFNVCGSLPLGSRVGTKLTVLLRATLTHTIQQALPVFTLARELLS